MKLHFHKYTKRGEPIYNSNDFAFVQTRVCEICGKIQITKIHDIYGTNDRQIQIIKEQLSKQPTDTKQPEQE